MKVRESILILLSVLSSFAANVVAPTKAELEAMYAAAAREVNAGHYRDALQKLDAIDARQPDVAAAQNLRGVAWMRMGEYGKAETALRKAREIDPEFWEARFNLAEVPFLKKNWAEARHRFEALAARESEQVQGATSDLIQFKILLTLLLEGKEKMGAEIVDKLKASRDSPALYYAKAAIALRHKEGKDAKVQMAAAEKQFSAQLNKLFAESFYEVGWLPKSDGATPVSLEVTSTAERVAQAQTDLGKAERAYRQQEFEEALQFLDQVDAAAPNQAVSSNLRGKILLEQGKDDEAEAALRATLAADPQFEDARYNLARIPFKKREYEASRKQLEALLGATSGGKQQRQRGQLIRYQIFLTLLLEGKEGAAQKAMDEFKMMDDTPALYYAQAAWAFQHGNPRQGSNWVANAGNLFPAELNRSFAASFADLGWPNRAEATPAPTQAVVAKTDPTPEPSPDVIENPLAPLQETKVSSATSEETPAPTLAETGAVSAPLPPTPAPEASAKAEEVASVEEKRAPEASAKAEEVASVEEKRAPEASVKVEEVASVEEKRAPEASVKVEKVATVKEKRSRKHQAGSTHAKKKRSTRASAAALESVARAEQIAAQFESRHPSALPAPPPLTEENPPARQKLGDKVSRLLLYPFQHRKKNTASPTPEPSAPAGKARRSTRPPEQSPAKN